MPARERLTSSGSDPLAELARLIGQNDPFAESGNARRASAPPTVPAPQVEPAGAWSAPPPAFPPPPAYQPQPQGAHDLYHTEPGVPGYAQHADAAHEAPHGDYEHAGYDARDGQFAADEDYYDDVPPRRRMGIMAIAAVFVLAVVGTAGAFGYRALFGSHSAGPPPVIKPEAGAIKVPAEKSSKPITARLNSQDEKLVPREELPVDIKKVPGAVADNQGNLQPPAMGSGVIGGEPKKVHTIVIRPDGGEATASPPPAPPVGQPVAVAPAAPAPSPPQQQAAPVAPAPVPPRVNAQAAPAPAPPHANTQAQAAPPAQPQPQRVLARADNAPLSLAPDAPAPAPKRAAPPQPMHTASSGSQPVAIAPAAAGGSGYAVQLSSQKSESEAQAAFHALQSKYPAQLGGKQPLIRRVELGEKGTYYRAMIGPFGSQDEASKMCSSLKAAGGTCFVQRI